MSDTIFDRETDLQVDFSSLKQDLIKRGRSRLLSQFWDSPVINAVLDCISQETQELYDALLEVQEQRTIAKATGAQLDMIGRLVGASKMLVDYDLLPWFAPDIAGREVDSADMWVTNAPLTGTAEADQNLWRNIILAKIFKNHMSFASLPEIRMLVKIMTGLKTSFIETGMQTVQLVVPATASRATVRFLAHIIRNIDVDFSYMLPLPPEVELDTDVLWLAIQDDTGQFCSFGPDMEQGRPDYGRATLTVSLIGEIA